MDKTKILPFASPEIGEEEIEEVVKILRSGWITTGPLAKKFEEKFAEYIGGGVEAVAVNSATAGLHLSLEALGVGPGDEVITTTHTFTATAEVIRYLGADPVFVDIDPKTLCIDVEAVSRMITDRTKVIIPVHFGGRAADLSRLIPLAKRFGIFVVEDAAHALPTTCEGRIIGAHESDVTVFSFYANKTITTGEGGMIVSRNKNILDRTRIMRLHGINRDAFDRFTAKVPSWYYEVVAPGFKYNMMDMCAAIGIHQLRRADSFQKRRSEIAERYDNAFRDVEIVTPPHAQQGDVHSWHLYVCRISNGSTINRDRIIDKMYQNGVGCSVHYIPLHLHPYWREKYNLTPSMFPVSQDTYERSISLPIYSRMTDNDVDRVISALKEIVE